MFYSMLYVYPVSARDDAGSLRTWMRIAWKQDWLRNVVAEGLTVFILTKLVKNSPIVQHRLHFTVTQGEWRIEV